jgi:copper chaperone CopZ
VAERAVAVGSVEITFDEALLDEAALRAAIDDAGFEVTSVSYA